VSPQSIQNDRSMPRKKLRQNKKDFSLKLKKARQFFCGQKFSTQS
jgi:hypothetical protein